MAYFNDVSPGYASVLNCFSPGKSSASYLAEALLIVSNHTYDDKKNFLTLGCT